MKIGFPNRPMGPRLPLREVVGRILLVLLLVAAAIVLWILLKPLDSDHLKRSGDSGPRFPSSSSPIVASNPKADVPANAAADADRRGPATSSMCLIHLCDGAGASPPGNTALRRALVALPIGPGWVRNELDRGRSAFDVARSLYSGRRSDILYAGTDDEAGVLYVVGVDGAMAAMAEDYPRFVREMDKLAREGLMRGGTEK